MSSVNRQQGQFGQTNYSAAKAGVVALGRTVADELNDSGVTANVLMPSVIDTPATRASLPYADYVNWPTPDEIAAVAEFLLSEDSGVMTGEGDSSISFW